MEFKQILGKVAPFLGGLIGGPLGASVGGIVGNLLGVDPTDEKALGSALQSATPDQLIALKQIDSAERMRIAQLANESLKIDSDDRASARNMQINSQDFMPSLLGIGTLFGYFSVIAILFFYPLQGGAKDIIYILVGGLSASLVQIMNFYFGSSAGSQKKDGMIYKSTPL